MTSRGVATVGVFTAVHLGLFAVPATVAWRDTLNDSLWLPLVGLAGGVIAGLGLLAARQRAGFWLLVGTVISAVLQILLTIGLVLAYTQANPGWDLS